jgi:hypothetical protein
MKKLVLQWSQRGLHNLMREVARREWSSWFDPIEDGDGKTH